MGTLLPQSSGMPRSSLVIDCTRMQRVRKIVRVDSEIEVLDPVGLRGWQPLPRCAGLVFDVRWANVVTRFALCDQGRNLGRTRSSMGLGVKLCRPRGAQQKKMPLHTTAPLQTILQEPHDLGDNF